MHLGIEERCHYSAILTMLKKMSLNSWNDRVNEYLRGQFSRIWLTIMSMGKCINFYTDGFDVIFVQINHRQSIKIVFKFSKNQKSGTHFVVPILLLTPHLPTDLCHTPHINSHRVMITWLPFCTLGPNEQKLTFSP